MLTQELMNDLDFLMDLLLPPISFILKHIGSKILGMTSHCGCKSCFKIFSSSLVLSEEQESSKQIQFESLSIVIPRKKGVFQKNCGRSPSLLLHQSFLILPPRETFPMHNHFSSIFVLREAAEPPMWHYNTVPQVYTVLFRTKI